jgi:hypothetical protein
VAQRLLEPKGQHYDSRGDVQNVGKRDLWGRP